MSEALHEEPDTLMVVSSYHIGKERAYLGAAAALGLKVRHAHPYPQQGSATAAAAAAMMCGQTVSVAAFVFEHASMAMPFDCSSRLLVCAVVQTNMLQAVVGEAEYYIIVPLRHSRPGPRSRGPHDHDRIILHSLQVLVPAAKLRVLQLLDLPQQLMSVVTTTDASAQLHVGCTSLAPDELQAYLEKQQQQGARAWMRIMGFRATGELQGRQGEGQAGRQAGRPGAGRRGGRQGGR